jgi:hypothetical protein
MKFRRRLITGVAVLVALLLSLPFLIPARLFVAQAEKAASESFGDAVHIEAVRVFVLPAPHLALYGVAVGKTHYLTVEKISLRPELLSLFGERLALSRVELTRLQARQDLMDHLERLQKKQQGQAPTVQVRRIVLREAQARLKEASFGEIDGDVELAEGNALHAVQLSLQGRALRLRITPEKDSYALEVSARNWRLPAGPPLTITSLESAGVLTRNGLILRSIDARLYDGTLQGTMYLAWANGAELAGQLHLSDAEIRPIAALYSEQTTLSGRLEATSVIEMRAANLPALVAAPNVETDFSIQDGVLHRMDLISAASLLPGKETAVPGDTRFDRFSGHLSIDRAGFHFTGLKIRSGLLKAEGYVSISPRQELSGRIDTAVQGTGSLVGTPLAVSGTVAAPKLRPTKGTLAGAAAGTLLLGPVVGTTIGMKAAEFTERLFGPGRPPQKAAAPDAPAKKASAPAKKAAPPREELPVEAQGRR